jgi:hypothetical protein
MASRSLRNQAGRDRELVGSTPSIQAQAHRIVTQIDRINGLEKRVQELEEELKDQDHPSSRDGYLRALRMDRRAARPPPPSTPGALLVPPLSLGQPALVEGVPELLPGDAERSLRLSEADRASLLC